MPHAKITILANEPIGHIRPELYGHFIEHLGHCVDTGIWVGPDSKIRNIDGIRTDVVEGSEPASQHMVAALEGTCSLDREDVGGLLDDTNLSARPVISPAYFAEIVRGEEAASSARAKMLGGVAQRASQIERSGILGRSQPEGDALRGARADAGQSPQFTSELAKRLGIIDGPHLQENWRGSSRRCVRHRFHDAVKSVI